MKLIKIFLLFCSINTFIFCKNQSQLTNYDPTLWRNISIYNPDLISILETHTDGIYCCKSQIYYIIRDAKTDDLRPPKYWALLDMVYWWGFGIDDYYCEVIVDLNDMFKNTCNY